MQANRKSSKRTSSASHVLVRPRSGSIPCRSAFDHGTGVSGTVDDRRSIYERSDHVLFCEGAVFGYGGDRMLVLSPSHHESRPDDGGRYQ